MWDVAQVSFLEPMTSQYHGRHFHSLVAQSLGQCTGLWKGFEKGWKFPSVMLSLNALQLIQNSPQKKLLTSIYIQTWQSQNGDANQLQAMSHTRLIVQQLQSRDCVAV